MCSSFESLEMLCNCKNTGGIVVYSPPGAAYIQHAWNTERKTCARARRRVSFSFGKHFHFDRIRDRPVC